MIKEGSKVKLIGVTDREDKQVYGTVLQFDPEGLAIVELKDKVCGILPRHLEEVE